MAGEHSSVLWVLLIASSIWLVAASSNSTQESWHQLKGDKSARSQQIPSSSSPAAAGQSELLRWQQSNKLLSVLKSRSANSTEPRLQQKRQAFNEPTSRRDDPWFLDQATHAPQPYRFTYNVKGRNGQTQQYRREVGDGKFLTGSYGYMLPDGIYRHVDYVADDRGFRAFIRTSEPGTANQNPADVVINSEPVRTAFQPLPYESFQSNPGGSPFNYTYSPLLLDSYSTLNNGGESDQPNRLPPLQPGSIVGGYLRTTSLPLQYTNLHPSAVNEKPGQISYIRGTDDALPPASRVDYSAQLDSRWNSKPSLLGGSEPGRLKLLEPSSLTDWTIRQAQFAPRSPTNTYKLSYDRLPYSLDEPRVAPIKLAYDNQAQTSLAPREGPPRSAAAALPAAAAPLQPISSLAGFSSSSQSFQSEENRQSNGSRFISKLGEPDQFSFRQQGSSTKSGSARELEYTSAATPADRDNNSNSEQVLLPPPPPQFNQLDELPQPQPQPQPQQLATKGGRGFLQAPYLRYRQETNEARPVVRDQDAVKGTPTSTGSDRNWVTSAPSQVGSVRTVRMPEELRASLAMKDLRAMRNNIGLPQPPRQVPSVIGDQLDSHFNRLDEAHKAHARRIDALLLSHPAAPADLAYSVQQQQPSESAAVSAPVGAPRPADRAQDAHSVSSGAQVQELKSAGQVGPGEPEFSQLAASNESFDARRLSSQQPAARAPQLLTERVSELEKFQQRLRAQQLLLENVKQPSGERSQRTINRLPAAAASPSSKPARSSAPAGSAQSADNSQVSYDEEPERSGVHLARKEADNRWPELGARSNQVAPANKPAGQQRAPASEFARDARTWPSLLSHQSNLDHSRWLQTGNSTNVPAQAPPSRLANQPQRSAIQQQQQQRIPSDAGRPGNGTEQVSSSLSQSALGGAAAGNTINLDFINSVTALSVDDTNPFAIASVNPGVARLSGKLSAEARLFPHRLFTASADSTRPATMNTRFFISPELRSAADYHDKHNTVGQLRSLFGSVEENEIEPPPHATPGRPNNHRFSAAAAAPTSSGPGGAPYMLGSASSASAARSAASQAPPIGAAKLVLNSLSGSKGKPTEELRSLEVSKHRFYEVASSSADRQPVGESVSAFVAFRG